MKSIWFLLTFIILILFTDGLHNKNIKQNGFLTANINQKKLAMDEVPSTTPLRKDFFSKTSDSNQNMAWKALGGFIAGILCLISSIYLICYNERRAVKETELIDYIRKEDKCVHIMNGVDTKVEENKVYAISGPLVINKPAAIDGLDINFAYGRNNILMIKLECEVFSKIKKVTRNSESEVENEEEIPQWSQNYNSKALQTKYFYADASINDIYDINVDNLSFLVEKNQTANIYENKYIHMFQNSEKNMMKDYFKSLLINMEFEVVFEREYAYLVKNAPSDAGAFSSSSFNFSEEDIRLKIKYVSNISLIFSFTSNQGNLISLLLEG